MWLQREQPDVVCLQEFKAPEGVSRTRQSRQRATAPSGTASTPGMAWPSWRAARSRWKCGAACRGPAGRRTAATSRPRWTASLVACLYLPNGNPQPGPKFDYKLAWFERLIRACRDPVRLRASPSVLAGDYNVVPTDFDIYNPRSWLQGRPAATGNPRVLPAPAGAGLDRLRSGTASRTSGSTRSGITFASTGRTTPGCASTTCC